MSASVIYVRSLPPARVRVTHVIRVGTSHGTCQARDRATPASRTQPRAPALPGSDRAMPTGPTISSAISAAGRVRTSGRQTSIGNRLSPDLDHETASAVTGPAARNRRPDARYMASCRPVRPKPRHGAAAGQARLDHRLQLRPPQRRACGLLPTAREPNQADTRQDQAGAAQTSVSRATTPIA